MFPMLIPARSEWKIWRTALEIRGENRIIYICSYIHNSGKQRPAIILSYCPGNKIRLQFRGGEISRLVALRYWIIPIRLCSAAMQNWKTAVFVLSNFAGINSSALRGNCILPALFNPLKTKIISEHARRRQIILLRASVRLKCAWKIKSPAERGRENANAAMLFSSIRPNRRPDRYCRWNQQDTSFR